MKNQDKILALLRKEVEAGMDGQMYIENACDGGRFVRHLLYLATDGKEGEKDGCTFFDLELE